MAYDEDFASRVGEQLADEVGVTEKAMFAGRRSCCSKG